MQCTLMCVCECVKQLRWRMMYMMLKASLPLGEKWAVLPVCRGRGREGSHCWASEIIGFLCPQMYERRRWGGGETLGRGAWIPELALMARLVNPILSAP